MSEEQSAEREAVHVFAMRDLTLKTIPSEVTRNSLGATFHPAVEVQVQDPDGDPVFPPALLELVMLDKFSGRLDVIEEVATDEIDMAFLDHLALDIGRGIVASRFFPGTAHCLQESPTCSSNPGISPYASLAEAVTNIDVGVARYRLTMKLEALDRLAELL